MVRAYRDERCLPMGRFVHILRTGVLCTDSKVLLLTTRPAWFLGDTINKRRILVEKKRSLERTHLPDRDSAELSRVVFSPGRLEHKKRTRDIQELLYRREGKRIEHSRAF